MDLSNLTPTHVQDQQTDYERTKQRVQNRSMQLHNYLQQQQHTQQQYYPQQHYPQQHYPQQHYPQQHYPFHAQYQSQPESAAQQFGPHLPSSPWPFNRSRQHASNIASAQTAMKMVLGEVLRENGKLCNKLAQLLQRSRTTEPEPEIIVSQDAHGPNESSGTVAPDKVSEEELSPHNDLGLLRTGSEGI